MTGMTIVIIALIFYTLALIKERKEHVLSRKLLVLFNIGLLFDITATVFMIAGSTNSPFTLHGFIGYSALTAMIIEVILLWRYYKSEGLNSVISSKIHKYTFYAYCWWVVAFITGGLIAALN